MKNYDDITASVLEQAKVRTTRIKRIRHACTLSVLCATCVVGGTAFLQLEKPEFMPDTSLESQSDPLYSASDPSAEVPVESTEETTTTVPETTRPETTTTAAVSHPVEIVTTEVTLPPDVIPIYVDPGTAPIATTDEIETYTTVTTVKHTTTTQKSETTTAVSETTKLSVAETTEAATTTVATAPATSNVTESSTTEEDPAGTDIQTDPTETETTIEPVPSETEPTDVTDPENPFIPSDKWDLFYELYLNGELPFTFEELMGMIGEEEETLSLFPIPGE